MKASEIAAQANNLTDENHDFQSVTLSFVNDGLAEINAELDASFPYCTANDEEIPFPEHWQRLVLIPFVAAKIKQKDSSQFEYNDLYGQFTNNLMKMKAKYSVPEEYKGNEPTSFSPDYSGHMLGW